MQLFCLFFVESRGQPRFGCVCSFVVHLFVSFYFIFFLQTKGFVFSLVLSLDFCLVEGVTVSVLILRLRTRMKASIHVDLPLKSQLMVAQ